MSAARHLLALGLIAIFACTAGCGDDDNVAPKTDSGITGDGNQIQPDGHVPGTDQGNTFTPCQCSADQVCDSNGSCIPAPQPKPTDYVGEIMLLRQTDLTQRTVLGSTWPTIGKPEAGFRLHEAIPEDFRVQFSTAEGETC